MTRSAAVVAIRAVISVHRLVLSPLLGPSCRFVPSCSQYALEAVDVHGPWRGAVLAARRVLRCHPFHAAGFDPVPSRPSPALGPQGEASSRVAAHPTPTQAALAGRDGP